MVKVAGPVEATWRAQYGMFSLLPGHAVASILDEYITEINNRPWKVLGWSTPAEVFHELCSKGTIT